MMLIKLNKNNEVNIQVFPALVSAAAFAFLLVLGTIKKDIVFYSLSHAALFVLSVLILIIVLKILNKLEIEFKEDAFRKRKEIIVIIVFLCICAWFIYRMSVYLKVPFSNLNCGIADAVLILLFPIVNLIYLKMKNDKENAPLDKITCILLGIFSYTSIVYALVITVSSVLNLNIIFILKWIYCAVVIGIQLFLAYNIVGYAIKKEKINISLKSLYTIKYALKIMPAVILGLGFVLFVSTSVFVVQPHQQALIFRFGTLESRAVKEEGIHFKLPFPIDKADIYDVHRVNSMQIGYQASYSANYLWTRSHDGGENTMLLGDGNEMVAVNIKVIYKIYDLYSYVRTYANPEEVLRAAAYEALMRRTVDTTLDEFLSVDRSSLSESLLQELLQFCKSENLGLSVIQVIIESIHPPVDIADIYQRVVTALVVKNTIITRAQADAAKKIIAAQQESRTVINYAAANGHSRISEAQKEMAVYYAAMRAYSVSPASFELVKYLDTYEKIIGNNKVYVFSPRMENAISKAVIGSKSGTNVIGVSNE